MNESVSAAGAVKKIWRAITGVISVVLLGILLWAVLILPNRMDVMMRDVNFPAYSQQSFAEVMAQFDPDGTWTYSAKSSRAMRKAGSGYAMWSGHVDMVENNGPCTSAPFSIRIDIQFNENDTYQYGISEIRIGGYCWDEEDMEDSPQTGQIMALIYGEQTEMSFLAYNRFGEPVEIYAAKPGTYSGERPAEPVEPDLPEPEQPEAEVPAADTADTAALPAAAEALTGCWQDIDGYGTDFYRMDTGTGLTGDWIGLSETKRYRAAQPER